MIHIKSMIDIAYNAYNSLQSKEKNNDKALLLVNNMSFLLQKWRSGNNKDSIY